MLRVLMVSPVLLVLAAGCLRSDEQQPSAGSSAAALSESESEIVLAKVGDRAITVGELSAVIAEMEPRVRLRFGSLERKKQLLEEMIGVELLAQQARKAKLDQNPQVVRRVKRAMVEQLVKQLRNELVKLSDITDEQVREHYEQQKPEQPLEELEEPIRNLLLVKQRQAAVERYLAQLRAKAHVELFEENLPTDGESVSVGDRR